MANERLLIGKETVVGKSNQLCSKHVDSEGPFDGKLHSHGLASMLVAENCVFLTIESQI